MKWGFDKVVLSFVIWLIYGLAWFEYLAIARVQMLHQISCIKDQLGNINCTCPEDPITEKYVDVKSKTCEFYYLCHFGVAIRMQCDTYSAFHPEIKECLPRTRVPKQICKPLVDCPIRLNGYIEDPDDCTKYYLCYYGKHSHWTCPEATYFEPEQERCLNDRVQAEACIVMAKRNFYKKLLVINEIEKLPQKTSLALTAARAFKKKQ